MSDLASLQQKLHQFADERDWNQFHSPKNIAMALMVEVGELLEHFQWLTEDESNNLAEDQLAEVAEEIADVQLYLIRLADKLNVDIFKAAHAKIDKNAEKYPVSKAKGKADKYNRL